MDSEGVNSDGWTPNGCAKCGQPERGHPDGRYAYVPPSDALRLARMRARRDARLNPPPAPELTPEMFATFAVDTAKFAEVMQRLGEVFARTLNPLVAQMRSLAFAVGATVAEANWPAEGSTCAHVCGPDAGHVCDARAVTTLRHALPSGGVRHLPLCWPCAAAENAEAPPADSPPQFDRLFVIAATRVQFTEWCHDLGIAPRDRRVVHLTDHRQLEGVARGFRYLVLDWPEGPGFAAVAIRDTLRSRDAVPVGDGEFAAWRAALNFTAATHRLLTDPGVAREEIEQAIAGVRALADNPDT